MNGTNYNLGNAVCHGRAGRWVGHSCPTFPNRAGFTFTEVMFAVILLGIGFIMLAGIFPVAIQQTQTNVEESTGSTIARDAAKYMEETLTVDDVPPTGNLDNTKGKIWYPRFLPMTQRCVFDGANNGDLINSN